MIRQFGSPYGRCPIDIDAITASSNLICIGVGKDITFEQEVIEQTGCAAYLYDGTPESVEWVNQQRLSPRILFFPVMIGTQIGKMPFYHHSNPSFVTGSLLSGGSWDKGSYCEVDVWTLGQATKAARIQTIDYLKISVGGGLESAILVKALKDWIYPKQIAVQVMHVEKQPLDELYNAFKANGYIHRDTADVHCRELWIKV